MRAPESALNGNEPMVTQAAVGDFQSLIENLPDAIVIVDNQGQIVLINAQTEKLLGYAREQLLGQQVEILVPERYRERHVAQRIDYATAPHTRPMGSGLQITARKADGTELPVEISLSPLLVDRGQFVITSLRDVTEQRHAQSIIEQQKRELETVNAQLVDLATRDSLTGLKNRRALEEKLYEELQRARRFRTPLSILIIDIDNFKEYNDSFGHQAGDEALTRVGEILEKQARATDFVARYGGEEFVILLANSDREGSMMLAARYRSAIEEAPWKFRRLSASIGAATFDASHESGPGPCGGDLFASADKALYESKRGGRNRATHADTLPVPQS